MIIDCAVAVDDLVLGGGIAGPVLDVGCHAGYLSAWWARHESLEVVGCDLCVPALELGRRQCDRLGRAVELVEGDCCPTETKGGSS
ncbi:MAG: hypothetical protein CM1200mP2_22680 [Planctomycetaceae bacterium]|nr:MAG: hypothetical protein CM1200mP2_22680 [Planctomycetaceae bacterium]